MKNSTSNRYSDTTFGWIGIKDTVECPDSLDSTEVKPKYAEFEIKRTTKANSFLLVDELFYIAKKEYTGKASRLYHVYRMSDKRYICPSTNSKEDTIEMVKRKYLELDL